MDEKILYLKFFDQQLTSLGIATDERCFLHDTQTMGRSQKVARGVRIFERIADSPLVIIVEVSSARKLQIMNMNTQKELCHFYFASSIIAVRHNLKRLVVLLDDKIYIHEIPSLKVVHIIQKIPLNSNGILDYTVNSEKCLLVYPMSNTAGYVQVFDALKLKSKYQILAHESAVAIISFSTDGNLLATASEKGTLIRIWSTVQGGKLYEFRRGLRNAAICSIVFSLDNSLMAVSSDTETVHIFKLPEAENTTVVEDSWLTWMKASLPTQITGIFCEERAFASFTMPFQGTEKTCLGLVRVNDGVQIYVASFDGTLYIYSLNMELGGECPLLKQQKFIEEPVVPTMLRNMNINANPLHIVQTPSSPTTATLSESITSYVPNVAQIPGMVSNLLQSVSSMFESEQQNDSGNRAEGTRNKSATPETGVSDGESPNTFPVDLMPWN